MFSRLIVEYLTGIHELLKHANGNLETRQEHGRYAVVRLFGPDGRPFSRWIALPEDELNRHFTAEVERDLMDLLSFYLPNRPWGALIREFMDLHMRRASGQKFVLRSIKESSQADEEVLSYDFGVGSADGVISMRKERINLFGESRPKVERKRITAAEIHAEMYELATADLLEPAGFAEEEPVESERVKTLKKLGFTGHPEYEEFTTRWRSYQNNKRNADRGQEIYRKRMSISLRFPQYKFIAQDTLAKVMDKYGLILCATREFIGDIPEKNMLEMARFADQTQFTEEDNNTLLSGNTYLIAATPDQFKVVQPARQVNWLVDDPIVLRPVADGYLIVTAWGDEAKDPEIQNERNN